MVYLVEIIDIYTGATKPDYDKPICVRFVGGEWFVTKFKKDREYGEILLGYETYHSWENVYDWFYLPK